MTSVFNAIFGYYMIMLTAGAVSGVSSGLRGTPAGPGRGTPPAAPPPTGSPRSPGTAAGGVAGSAHRVGWATGIGFALGWASGRDTYRAGRRATVAVADRVKARRTTAARPTPARTPPTRTRPPAAPAAPSARPPAPGPAAPAGAATPRAAAPPPIPASPAITPPAPSPAPALAAPADPATTPPNPNPATLPPATRRAHLTLVPQPQEIPPTMPATDITDLETLITFTGQTHTVAGIESEDAAAASASMIAGSEFAGDTAQRVQQETAAIEHAIAVMAALGVDNHTATAYHHLRETGETYRALTAEFAARCHEAAATAATMATAAGEYQQAADNALRTVNTHQLPHAEAAATTGHSGANGTWYGVTDTHHTPLPPRPAAPALPSA